MVRAMPERIQRRRSAGGKLPDGAKVISRPGRWGNRYRLAKPGERYAPLTVVSTRNGRPTGTVYAGFTDKADAIKFSVELFRHELAAAFAQDPTLQETYLGPLVGLDLACFCALPSLGEPDICHGAVLLAFADTYSRTLPERVLAS
jgi:hypothetical protein